MPTNAINDTGVKYIYDKLNGKKLEASTLASEYETEATTTATKAHTKDSKFYLAATGEYCMAKTAIAIGDTLVENTNYVVITINGFLTDLETYLILAGQMLETKADKVTNATNGNLAGLDGNGNPTDSGWNGAKDTTSISGNPISISGLKANQLAKNPIITLEPIQAGSGTPSPSNIRAISGYDKIEVLSCNNNLWDETWEAGEYNNSGVKVTGQGIRSKNKIMVHPGTTYATYSPVTLWVCFYMSDGTFKKREQVLANAQIVVPSDVYYITFNTASTYGETYGNNISIKYTSSQSGYVAPNKTTSISESLGQTVYGATWYPRTGVLKSKEKTNYIVLDGTANWTEQTNGGNKRYYVPSGASNVNENSVEHICNMALIAGGNNASQCYTVNDRFAIYANGNVYLSGNIASDVTALKALLNTTPLQICYTVVDSAEKTIQLTPHEISLLKNYAYLSTNGTSIALDYHNGELASLADVSQVGETVNELSQAFQDGCDKIMGAVAAKGVTPASNSPDDISKAIRSLVTYEQPIEFDYRCGYITNGVWYYEKPTNTLSDIYEVKNGHTYYMFFGNTTGTRFRAITTTTDIRTVTSGTITGDQTVKNSSNPGPLSYVTFTSTVDGYFIVCKDNVGKTGITTYMQDRTTM